MNLPAPSRSGAGLRRPSRFMGAINAWSMAPMRIRSEMNSPKRTHYSLHLM
jgi:hypothetical protein